jgi:iron complex outermembrane recepter protein
MPQFRQSILMSVMAAGGFVAPVFAQQIAPVDPPAQADTGLSEVTVTGSRIVTNGVNAPTPVTVVSSDQLQLAAPRNLVDGVLQLPQLRGSVSVANQANGTTQSNGADFLNLRGLGTARTLVLMDGRRLSPVQSTSAVDASMVPEALVSRVDIVTGGASAAYGSDAVAGVVNFILNNKFTGLKVDAQGGLSTYGDNQNYKFDVTYGTSFADNRVHLVASALDYYSAGVANYSHRSWTDQGKVSITNPNVTATNPASPTNPKQIVVTNGFSSIAANGGLITNTALRGTTFDPNGLPRQFQYGSLVSSTQMQGGDPGTFNPNLLLTLQPEQHRDQVYLHLTGDVTDNLSVYLQAVGSKNQIQYSSIPTFELGPTAFTLFQDNAYLPASVRQSMVTGKISSFSLGRLSPDIAVPSVSGMTNTGMLTAGFDGKAFAGWQYHGYAQIGRSKASYNTNDDPISDNLYRAADAVVNPANGQTVCRSTLANPGNRCVPIDLFGAGAPSQAALNYILGMAQQVYYYDQYVGELSASGALASLPAGDLSLAFGVDWREEKLRITADPTSQEIRTGTGINGYPIGLINTLGGFERTNPQPAEGEYSVTEPFAELEVPLLKNVTAAHSLALNGAIRFVHYSTSGNVTPWKYGLVWEPLDWVRFRATHSRDIRAPNLGELFGGSSQGTANVVDPFNQNRSSQILTGLVGNPNLQPEIAQGKTAGVVFTPREWLDGLDFSVDYYTIRIDDAIATLGAQQELNNCFLGVQSQCAFIQRAGDGSLARILTPSQNAAFEKTSGVDLEASYSSAVPRLGARLSSRLIVNYLNELTTGVGGAVPIDTAGDMSQAYPKWVGTFQTNLSFGKPSLFFQERVVSSGKYTSVDLSGGPVTSSSISANRTPAVFYTDMTLSYDVSDNVNAYFSVNNLFDKNPPMLPSYLTAASSFGNSPVGGVRGLYDFIGRMFTIGVHVKM